MPVDIPEVAGAWCSAHILGDNTRGWEYRAGVEGISVMRGWSRSQLATGEAFRNRFRTTIFEVP